MSEKRAFLKTRYKWLRVWKAFSPKKQTIEYGPSFIVGSNFDDIDVRGGKLRAVYNYDSGFWVDDWNRAIEVLDAEIYETAKNDAGEALINNPDYAPSILLLSNTDNQQINKFRNYVEHQMGDITKPLNQTIIFSNQEVKKEDRATFALDYPLLECDTPFYNKMMDRLYSEERTKIEWLIGCIINGDQTKVQKLFVFYGEPGTGKSTIINKVIVDAVLGGSKSPYCTKFTAELLGNRDSFGTDFLSNDPIIAFDDDADLSRIESNTTLNLIISHEAVRVNAKFAKTFTTYPNCFLICGTNEPVKLSPNSGLNRRLIDIRPTGEKLSPDEYDECIDHLKFERSGIAYKCLQVYKKLGKNYYNRYQPEEMLSMTSPFHNFVKDHFFDLKDGTTLSNAYNLYCTYCEECNFKTVITRYKFRDSLKLYFDEYDDKIDSEGRVTKNYFSGFKFERIGLKSVENKEPEKESDTWLKFENQSSLFDQLYSDAFAQYATENETPTKKWESVKTKLKDLDTSKLHYVKLPNINHIIIDFDLKDENGNKDFNKNLEAASKFPPTYAELSKSGAGIHLHYIYTGGDVEELSRVYADNIEIKVFKGNSSLRRRLSKCNAVPINEISSGLPLKGGQKMIDDDWDGYKNENVLRSMIIKNLNKEYHAATKPSVDYINDLLSKAKAAATSYDVRDLSKKVEEFAENSTHNSTYCSGLVSNMDFCSSDRLLKGGPENMIDWNSHEINKYLRAKIASYLQVEQDGIKDSIDAIDQLLNKVYREEIIYDVKDLEQPVFSLALQSNDKADYCVNAVSHMHFCSDDFNETNTSENDEAPIIILDIESYPEDEDGPAFLGVAWKYLGEDKSVVKMYNPSPNEVEELFKYRMVGHNIRGYDAHILYARSQGYTEAECNRLSQRIIAGDSTAKFREAYHIPYADTLDFAAANNKMGLKKWEYKLKKLYPQIAHQEMNLPWDKSAPKERWDDIMNYCANDVISTEYVWNYLQPDFTAKEILADLSGLTVIDTTNQCTTALLVGDIKDPQQYYIYTDLSKIFPGYEFSEYGIDKSRYNEGVKIVSGKSIYKGIDPGEGGRKIGYPGMYQNVGLFDVASMHPSSMIRLNIFGDKITKRLENLVKARIAIKHGDYATAIELLGEKVRKYLTGSEEELKSNAKALANALKTAINSVYGLTSAAFDNKLRDPRNKDNIVAKYGALFMINLEEEVTKRGYKVVHVSTDSIKVANVDDKIAKFIMDYGKEYGFTFEYEALYSKMCLINDAVYIARVEKEDGEDVEPYWTATGKQFAVPYVFKTLFSHEEIIFDDMCETFQVKEGAIYLDYNEALPDVSEQEKKLKKLKKDELAVASGQIKLLEDEISKGHNYQFVGNIGQFTPIVDGHGGAVLYRIKDGNASAVQGTKGFRWLESESMKILGKEEFVDRNYYRKLVDEAIAAISEFGDSEWFMSTGPDEIPFELD